LSAHEELTLNIFSSPIPGLSIGTQETFWMGGSTWRTDKLTFEPWSVNFTVDSLFRNWRVLYEWITYINNNKDKFYEFHKDFTVDVTIRVFDNFKNQVFEIFLTDVFITELGEARLSQREDETYIESIASFRYDRYELRSYITEHEGALSSSVSSSSHSSVSSSSSSQQSSSSSSVSSS
jgi:hypothetical protein